MTGLLPQGCKTVNEAAAALAIDRAEKVIFYEDAWDYDLAIRFSIRHDKIVQWLALRNDRRIAELEEMLPFDDYPCGFVGCTETLHIRADFNPEQFGWTWGGAWDDPFPVCPKHSKKE